MSPALFCNHYSCRLLRVDLLNPLSVCNRPYSETFFQFQRNLICGQRSMSDTWRYAIWPDPRSRSRRSKSYKNGRFQSLSPLPVHRCFSAAVSWMWSKIRQCIWYIACSVHKTFVLWHVSFCKTLESILSPFLGHGAKSDGVDCITD